jgi:hypothetical protein
LVSVSVRSRISSSGIVFGCKRAGSGLGLCRSGLERDEKKRRRFGSGSLDKLGIHAIYSFLYILHELARFIRKWWGDHKRFLRLSCGLVGR